MNPKWQRAIALASWGRGPEVWVKIAAPEDLPQTRCPRDGVIIPCVAACETNVTDELGRPCVLSSANIERLARSEADFAEDVPLIPWQQFLEECRKGASDAQ